MAGLAAFGTDNLGGWAVSPGFPPGFAWVAMGCAATVDTGSCLTDVSFGQTGCCISFLELGSLALTLVRAFERPD